VGAPGASGRAQALCTNDSNTLTNRLTGAVIETAWTSHQLTLPEGFHQLEFDQSGTYSFKLTTVQPPG